MPALGSTSASAWRRSRVQRFAEHHRRLGVAASVDNAVHAGADVAIGADRHIDINKLKCIARAPDVGARSGDGELAAAIGGAARKPAAPMSALGHGAGGGPPAAPRSPPPRAGFRFRHW